MSQVQYIYRYSGVVLVYGDLVVITRIYITNSHQYENTRSISVCYKPSGNGSYTPRLKPVIRYSGNKEVLTHRCVEINIVKSFQIKKSKKSILEGIFLIGFKSSVPSDLVYILSYSLSLQYSTTFKFAS
jgi:hypothetical protein